MILGRGKDTLSDPVYFPVQAFQKVAISAYVRRRIPLATQHASASQISYLSPKGSGDVAAEAAGASFDHRSQHWFLIDELDVSAPPDSGAVVALGDSITDGVRSPVGQDKRYPDYLSHRLSEAGVPLTAVNSGISGNALTIDASSRLPMGPAVLSRLDTDVNSVPGARAVIVEGGLNDLAYVDPDAVTGALSQIVQELQSKGLTVVLTTLTPSRGSSTLGDVDEIDAGRQLVNAWISSQSLAPVADFDAVLEDPSNPGDIAPEYASPDGLHPNAAGYEALARLGAAGGAPESVLSRPLGRITAIRIQGVDAD